LDKGAGLLLGCRREEEEITLLMHSDRSTTTITQIDATVQRLLTLREEHGRRPSHPLLRQTLAQIDEAIEELQVMFEELAQRHDEVTRLTEAIEAERTRRRVLMESLSVACLFTDATGAIHEANTSALLLLGARDSGLGRDTLQEYVADPVACDAIIARLGSEPDLTATFWVRRRAGAPVAVSASVSRVRHVHPPLWRWFLLRSRDRRPDAGGKPAACAE
jgi:PAS domain-containing protein